MAIVSPGFVKAQTSTLGGLPKFSAPPPAFIDHALTLTWKTLKGDRLFATIPAGANKSHTYQRILDTYNYNQGSSDVRAKIVAGGICAIIGVVFSIFTSDPFLQYLGGPAMDLAAIGLFYSAYQESRARKLVVQDEANGHAQLQAWYKDAEKEIESPRKMGLTEGVLRAYTQGPLHPKPQPA